MEKEPKALTPFEKADQEAEKAKMKAAKVNDEARKNPEDKDLKWQEVQAIMGFTKALGKKEKLNPKNKEK